MKIYTRQVLKRGLKKRIITKVEGMMQHLDLPEQYTSYSNHGSTFFLQASKTKIAYRPKTEEKEQNLHYCSISLNQIVEEKDVQTLLRTIEEGIQNLQNITKSLPKWDSEEVFTFLDPGKDESFVVANPDRRKCERRNK